MMKLTDFFRRKVIYFLQGRKLLKGWAWAFSLLGGVSMRVVATLRREDYGHPWRKCTGKLSEYKCNNRITPHVLNAGHTTMGKKLYDGH